MTTKEKDMDTPISLLKEVLADKYLTTFLRESFAERARKVIEATSAGAEDWPEHPTWQMNEAGGEVLLQAIDGDFKGLTAMQVAEGVYAAMRRVATVAAPSESAPADAERQRALATWRLADPGLCESCGFHNGERWQLAGNATGALVCANCRMPAAYCAKCNADHEPCCDACQVGQCDVHAAPADPQPGAPSCEFGIGGNGVPVSICGKPLPCERHPTACCAKCGWPAHNARHIMRNCIAKRYDCETHHVFVHPPAAQPEAPSVPMEMTWCDALISAPKFSSARGPLPDATRRCNQPLPCPDHPTTEK